MKEITELLWSIFTIISVLITYYGAWQHNWVIILIFAMPQVINAGYQIGKK